MVNHLIVKTSSLGDIVHMLPALTDAAKEVPDASFDWVTEKSFSEIPAWHPNIDKVITYNLRKWRNELFKLSTWSEFNAFRGELRQNHTLKPLTLRDLLKAP